MKIRVLVAAGAALVLVTACSGDDDGGSGGKQGEVADMVLEEMEGEGVTMDEECVRDAAGELSDEDAQKVLDAGPGGDDSELSPEAAAAAAELVNCIDTDVLVDEIVEDLVENVGTENVDVECLKDALRDVDMANLDSDDTSLVTAMTECTDLEG